MGNADDGCVEVNCPKHGRLARIFIGADIFCRKCGKWIKAETSAQAQKRQKARERKRQSRARVIPDTGSLGHQNVTLLGQIESATYELQTL